MSSFGSTEPTVICNRRLVVIGRSEDLRALGQDRGPLPRKPRRRAEQVDNEMLPTSSQLRRVTVLMPEFCEQ